MNTQPSTNSITRARRRRAGLSLMELLVSLAITATLLTAVGVAYTAAADAIQNNDQFFRAQQAARVSIGHVMSSVRQCTEDPVISSTSLQVIVLDKNPNPSLNHGLETRTYQYDPDAKTLSLSKTFGLSTETAVMARNVRAVQFGTSGDQVSMTITIQIGANQVLLNGSALPRRLVEYAK